MPTETSNKLAAPSDKSPQAKLEVILIGWKVVQPSMIAKEEVAD